jgi:hypothetical protein
MEGSAKRSVALGGRRTRLTRAISGPVIFFRASTKMFLHPPNALPKSPLTNSGPFVYRLGRQVFNLKRGVRLPYGLPRFYIKIDSKQIN